MHDNVRRYGLNLTGIFVNCINQIALIAIFRFFVLATPTDAIYTSLHSKLSLI